jgi:hypothetical protein
MFLRCPAQYEFRYINGLKRPPGAALLLGKSWHAVVEKNYVQKMITKEDLPLEEMCDSFSDIIEGSAEEEEFVFFEDESIDSLKDLGIRVTSIHHQAIAPKVSPLLVEQEFRIPLATGKDLLGYIDLVDNAGGLPSKPVVVDNKSYKRKPVQGDFDKDLQFSIYALAYRLMTGSEEAGLRMDCVIKTKILKTEQLHTTRDISDLTWTIKLVEKVDAAINTGIFPPNPTGWCCSKKWCGYWNECKGK